MMIHDTLPASGTPFDVDWHDSTDWTDADERAAILDGWDLFWTGDELQLQRIDDPEDNAEQLSVPALNRTFDRDDDAVAYVKAQALAGNRTCRKAIDRLIAGKSGDVLLFNLAHNW